MAPLALKSRCRTWQPSVYIGLILYHSRSQRAVLIKNSKERQTYYGAIDFYSREFVLQPYAAGNGQNTVAFIQNLQQLHAGKKLLLIWDGASYHRCSEMKAYLAKVNEGLEEKN
jgi:fido (protein-threonine AMPylation protein)